MASKKEKALARIQEVANLFVSAEDAFMALVKDKVWLDAGLTLEEMLNQYFSGLRFVRKDVLVTACVAFLEEGATPKQVAEFTGGKIRPSVVENVKEWMDAGVPAEAINPHKPIYVREQYRELPSARTRLHIELDTDDYNDFIKLAKKLGSSYQKEAENAIRSRLDVMRAEASAYSR